MNIGPSLELAVAQKLRLEGNAAASIFPRVEKWLQETPKNWEALQYVASRKEMTRYRSIVDFLFCEIYVDYQKHCFRYYQGLGKQLQFIISKNLCDEYEQRLIAGLQRALESFQEKRRLSWTSFRCEVISLAA